LIENLVALGSPQRAKVKILKFTYSAYEADGRLSKPATPPLTLTIDEGGTQSPYDLAPYDISSQIIGL